MSHSLDSVVHRSLTGRQAHLAVTKNGARRFHPAFGVFAALDDTSAAALTGLRDLVTAHGDVALVDTALPANVGGLKVLSEDLVVQMTLSHLNDIRTTRDAELLTGADASQMLALAQLTQPGPFFERTHELGDFFGLRVDGRLVAMAGERMKPDGFTEVSGVCTHPDHRGRGYAGALMCEVIGRILARGETPFLHAYASNTGAIALYERLGFTLRRTVTMRQITSSQDA